MNNLNTCILGSSLLTAPLMIPGNWLKGQELQQLKNIKDAPERNVIFILSDDHRYDFFGFTGKIPWLRTPGFDKLAGMGAYFNNAFVTTSLSSPSRASILTGQYSHVHKVVDNVSKASENLVFFPQYLQKKGYQTGFFGKWHMGNEDDNPQPGFDHWESLRGQGQYFNPALNINGKRRSFSDSTYISDLLTEHALEWLKNRDKRKPFFLYLSHKAVHENFEPAPRHRGLYSGEKLPLPPTYWQTFSDEYKKLGWPEWVKQQRYSWHGTDYILHQYTDIHDYVRRYCETLMGIDESVEAVMDYLKSEKLESNTIVIYMGDNGFSWGEHGLTDKRQFYEESAKVPLLIYSPDLKEGGITIRQMVQNIDIAPSILSAAGLQKPDYMPGESFLRLIEGDMAGWRDKIFYEYFWEYNFPMTPTMFGVRTNKYKYIRYYGLWDTNELYDLENDPDEMYNLIEKPEYSDVARKLAEDLYNWLETTGGMQIPVKKVISHPHGDYRHPMQY